MTKKIGIIFLIIILLGNILIPQIGLASENTLESQKYNILEEKGYITRIIPETKIEEFKQKFNIESSKIHVYEGETEIEEGNIKTGMIATFEGFEKRYELSVIGDINSDGQINQIDLNLLIKHIVGYEAGQIKGLKERISRFIRR